MANNPFVDHLQNRGNGGGSVNDNRNRGGGNNNKNKNKGNNNNKNKKNNNGGGGGGGDLIPDLPEINAGVGLNAPGTGSISSNPFDIGTSMTASPPPPSPALPTNLPATAKPPTPNGGTSGAPQLGGTLPPPPPPPLYSDENDYEHTFFNNNPQAGYQAMLQEAGLHPGAADAYGQWLKRQYDQMFQNYQGLTADDANQALTWFDYLGNLGGTPYGNPGWRDAFRNYLTLRYRNASLDDRGLDYGAYEGPSRTIYFGN